MPYQDFRQFLDVLRQQGELIDVDRPIALTDVGKALKQAYQKGRPAVSASRTVTFAVSSCSWPRRRTSSTCPGTLAP